MLASKDNAKEQRQGDREKDRLQKTIEASPDSASAAVCIGDQSLSRYGEANTRAASIECQSSARLALPCMRARYMDVLDQASRPSERHTTSSAQSTTVHLGLQSTVASRLDVPVLARPLSRALRGLR